MILNKNGIQFSLEPTLLDRHGESSPRSDFQGRPFELLLLTASTFESRIKEAGCLEKLEWGKTPSTFVLRNAPTENFRAIGGSRIIHGMEKPPADDVDLIIRVERSPKGKVRGVELIDFQAWPIHREAQSAA